MKEDSTEGENIQAKLNALTGDTDWKDGEADLPNVPTVKTNLAAPSGCQDLFFRYEGASGASDKAFMTEPLGIDKWYGYKKFYDFKTGKNIYPKNLTQEGIDQVDAEAAHLKGLLWMSYGKVSFAVRAPWVIGRFCIPTGAQTPPDKKTPVDNFRNVNDVCEGSWKYNRCYNDMALRFHNEKRALHANTPNLKFDTGIAQTIQFHMDKDGFDGTIQDLGPYSSCLQ